MLTTNISFSIADDTATGNGWVLTSWDDSVDEPVITETKHASLTAAAAQQKVLWQADTGLAAHLTDQAEATVLADNASEITTAYNARRTAEGLT